MSKSCFNCRHSLHNNNTGVVCALPCDMDNYKSWEIIDDVVTAPTHYTTGAIECIDAIRSALTEEEFRGYCKGNVLKYTWREKLKGGDEDLKKAKQYIEFMGVEK